MDRVMIFIDGSNLYKALQAKYGKAKIDLGKFSEKLCGNRKLIRTNYYNSTIPEEMDSAAARAQQRFFSAVERLPYTKLLKGRLERRDNTWIEKGVDIMIATDMMRHAANDNYDVAILVSSDGDFKYVIDAVCDMGKHVENAYVSGHRAYHLNICDRFIEIDDFIDECWLP